MIHSLAVVHPDTKIAESAEISQFATVEKNVEIGEGTWIGPNAVIMEGTRIGKNCKVFPGAVISAIPQDLKFEGEDTTVEIGDNTTIRECATINRGTKAKGATIIGKNCLIMSYVHIAHDSVIGNNCILVSYSGVAGEVVVDDWATIASGALVHQFVHIGKHVFIQGLSKVQKDVPPFILAGREPLAYAGLNSVGLKRRGFSTEKIREMQEIYRIIYQNGMNNTAAVEHIEKNIPQSEERDDIINFIKNSKRGIIRGLLD